MQNSLVGYLLGALDQEETARLEARLKHDPALQAELELARKSLQPLRLDADDINPPTGLATRACQLVFAARPSVAAPLDQGVASSTWHLVDVAIAASVLLGACLLCLPALNNTRYHAQVAGCQNNLRNIGLALVEYSENAHGFFPTVPDRGNLAVAGMYAPTLKAFDVSLEDHRFLCPASPNIDDQPDFRVPSIEEVTRAQGQTLAVLQRRMGGHFGYTLGYHKNGKLQGIVNQHRNHFPVMSDAPPESRYCEMPRSTQHRNILFESGRVRAVSVRTVCWRGDQLFTNDKGEVSAGVDASDAVIAASGTSPGITTVSLQY